MVYGTYNELVTGANLNQLITGGHHIVGDVLLPGHYILDPRGSKRQASMPPVRQSQHSYIRGATLPEQRATGVGAIKQGQHQWLKNMYILGVETAAVIQNDASNSYILAKLMYK